MKETKEKHNSEKNQRQFSADYVFRNQDPDKRTCRQWVSDMNVKFGINWINQAYTRYMIDLEDGIVKPNPKKKK